MTSIAVHRRGQAAARAIPTATRVVSYTRRSVEKERVQFGSVEAQRQAIANYVASQKERGWTLLPEAYEDRNLSGATTERPGLQRLLADAEAGRFEVLCLYKFDRISRCLVDFLDLIRRLEGYGVTVVSVTQAIDTSTPSGRLMLNVLASFAEYERETIAERIRDKMTGARRLGKWQGGRPVLGYDVADKRLAVSDAEAVLVREIFETYLRIGCVIDTLAELKRRAIANKRWTGMKGHVSGGQPFSRFSLRNLLGNRLYRGEIPVDGDWVAGEHKAIVPQALWDEVQVLLASRAEISKDGAPHSPSGATLQSLLRCGTCGSAMTPAHARKGPRRYQYYICVKLKRFGRTACPGSRVAAAEVEAQVIAHLRQVARDPAVLTATVEAARREQARERERLTAELRRHEADVRRLHVERARLVDAVASGDSKAVASRLAEVEQAAEHAAQRIAEIQAEIAALEMGSLDESALRDVLLAFDPVWAELGAPERTRVLTLLLDRVVYDNRTHMISLAYRTNGMQAMLADVTGLKD